jgi:4-amino-4-deoxy-L-arabinose transferase-like glycosyltransferase
MNRLFVGIDARLISENVAIGVAIVLLSPLVWYLGSRLPLLDMLAAYFMPLAFVALLTYFRSGQRTRGQSIAEGVFAGCIFLVVMTFVSAVFGFFSSQGA